VLQQIHVDELVSKLVQMEGSDLHLKVGAPLMIRANGVLRPLEGYEVLRPVDT
jgi:twitching motility protein PilT